MFTPAPVLTATAAEHNTSNVGAARRQASGAAVATATMTSRSRGPETAPTATSATPHVANPAATNTSRAGGRSTMAAV